LILRTDMNKQLAGKCREGDSRGSDLKGLGDDVVVEADVVPAVAAAVDARPHQLRHRPSPRRAASPEYPRPDQSDAAWAGWGGSAETGRESGGEGD